MDFNKTPKENIEQLKGEINRLKFMERKSYRTLKMIEEDAYQISRQIILGQDPLDKFALENDLRQIHENIKELKREIISLKSIRVDLESDVGAEYVGFGKKKLLEMKKFMMNHGIDILRKRLTLTNYNKDEVDIFVESVNGFDTVRIEGGGAFLIFLHEYGSKAIFKVIVRNNKYEIFSVDENLNIVDIQEYSGGAYIQSNRIQNEHYVILPRLTTESNQPMYMGKIYRWGAYDADAKLWEGTQSCYKPENFVDKNAMYRFFNSKGFEDYWCTGRKNYTINFEGKDYRLLRSNESISKTGLSDSDIDAVYTLYAWNNSAWENKGIIARNLQTINLGNPIIGYTGALNCVSNSTDNSRNTTCSKNLGNTTNTKIETFDKYNFKGAIGNSKGLYIKETWNVNTTRNLYFHNNIRSVGFSYTRVFRHSYGVSPYTYKEYPISVRSEEIIKNVTPYYINDILTSKKYDLYIGNHLIDSEESIETIKELNNPIPTIWTLVLNSSDYSQTPQQPVEPGWIGYDWRMENEQFWDNTQTDEVTHPYQDSSKTGLSEIEIIDYDNVDGNDDAFICIYTKTKTQKLGHITDATLIGAVNTSTEIKTKEYILVYKLPENNTIYKVILCSGESNFFNGDLDIQTGKFISYVSCQAATKHFAYTYLLYNYTPGSSSISELEGRVIGIINMDNKISKNIPMGYRQEFNINELNKIKMLEANKNYNYKQISGIGINY